VARRRPAQHPRLRAGLREATIVKLERNYRSTQIILDAASAVIRQNRNRKDKHLWTDRKGGARIVYFRGGDELEEADFITRTARRALATMSRRWSRCCTDERAVADD
jgi:DNA helicase-2/ATP-dependent DNA helicase PcrA